MAIDKYKITFAVCDCEAIVSRLAMMTDLGDDKLLIKLVALTLSKQVEKHALIARQEGKNKFTLAMRYEYATVLHFVIGGIPAFMYLTADVLQCTDNYLSVYGGRASSANNQRGTGDQKQLK